MCGYNGSMHPSHRHRKPSTSITHDHHTMTIHRTRSPHDCHLTVIYTFLYETGNARCRAHHFPGARQTWQPPRRCGISPYNTSHITTTRPKSLTICKMTNPKRDAMSRTPHQLLPLNAQSSRRNVPQSETLICKLRQNHNACLR